MPRCLECGYDLRGLTDSDRCPECGRVLDPEAVGPEVVAWYRSRAGAWMESAPACFLAHLHHPSCRQAAIRRLIASFVVPTALFVLVVTALNCVTAFTEYERWVATQPQDIDRACTVGRPFGASHSAGGPLAYPHRRIHTSLSLTRPHFSVDMWPVFAAPVLAAAFGLVTMRWTVLFLINTFSEGSGDPIDHRAAFATLPWLAGPYTLGLATVTVAVVFFAVSDWGIASAGMTATGGLLLCAGCIVYLGSGMLLAARIARGCRPKYPGLSIPARCSAAVAWPSVQAAALILFAFAAYVGAIGTVVIIYAFQELFASR